MIKKVIAIALSAALLTYCGANTAQKDATSVGDGGWSFEGWGGPPEQRNDGKTPRDTNPKDYYYMKFASRASAKAIAKKNPVMVQSTCRESARLQGTSEVIRKMLGECHNAGFFTCNESNHGITTDCNPFISASLAKGVGIYECKATGPGSDPNDVSKDNWEECQCVIYAKFPGGRNALVAKVQEIGK